MPEPGRFRGPARSAFAQHFRAWASTWTTRCRGFADETNIGELADALLASRSAITGAVKVLETSHAVRRTRAAGERMDRVGIDLGSPQSLGMDITEYEELRELAREGLEVLRDAPAQRRAVLLEMSAFADFLLEQIPRFQQEWEVRRAALVAAGELPEHGGRR